jgi:hypothetical protein
MIQATAPYPHYKCQVDTAKAGHAFITLSYDQALEIANILYFVNTFVSKKRLFRKNPLVLDEEKRSMHKELHDACYALALSLEEAALYNQMEQKP